MNMNWLTCKILVCIIKHWANGGLWWKQIFVYKNTKLQIETKVQRRVENMVKDYFNEEGKRNSDIFIFKKTIKLWNRSVGTFKPYTPLKKKKKFYNREDAKSSPGSADPSTATQVYIFWGSEFFQLGLGISETFWRLINNCITYMVYGFWSWNLWSTSRWEVRRVCWQCASLSYRSSFSQISAAEYKFSLRAMVYLSHDSFRMVYIMSWMNIAITPSFNVENQVFAVIESHRKSCYHIDNQGVKCHIFWLAAIGNQIWK